MVSSCSPYSQPSFSSEMSSVMTSPCAKLSKVWFAPAVCGKMVFTFCFFTLFSPVATETDRCKLGSSEEPVKNEPSSDGFSRKDDQASSKEPSPGKHPPPSLQHTHSTETPIGLYFHTSTHVWMDTDSKGQQQSHGPRPLRGGSLWLKALFQTERIK